MKIQTNLTEGLVTGTRILQLNPISYNKTRIYAGWDIDLSGIPIIGRDLQRTALGKPQMRLLVGSHRQHNN